jgi:cell division protein FtsX
MTEDDESRTPPPVPERWWWSGAFRAVLGGIVVAYQWPVLTSGDANAVTWGLAAVGAVVALWGAGTVLAEYRRRT